MSISSPKVSVLVPLYETDHGFLREMIQSVLTQSFKDFELILLNDSPWDRTLGEVVSGIDDPRIVFAENEKNLGISESRNKLIDLAKGEYLAILDHDDVCLKDRLEKQVRFLDSRLDIGVVSGGYISISNGEQYFFPENNIEIKKTLLTSCCVMHSASMIRKSVLDERHIRYEGVYSPAEDFMLWVRLMGVTMFYSFPEVLIKYRDHENNTSHRQAAKMQDAALRVKSVARSLYPGIDHVYKDKIKVCLFGILSIIKIKNEKGCLKCYLFGFIPFF